MVAILAGLLYYIGTTVPSDFKPGEMTILRGVDYIYTTVLTIKIEFLLLAFLMYFGINVLFAVRLRRVLSKNGVKTSFGKTLLAQYAGMLTSDVTPGRSGYILTPVYLRDQGVPASKGLSSVLGIQTFEFLIKVAGGIGAVILLVTTVPASTWDTVFKNVEIAGVNAGLVIAILGISLMAVGAVILITGIGGNLVLPNSMFPFQIPYLFPNGIPAIVFAAILGILVNTIFLIFKAPEVRGDQ